MAPLKGADTIDITKSADTIDVIKAKYAAREKQMIESIQPESSPITPDKVAQGACKRKAAFIIDLDRHVNKSIPLSSRSSLAQKMERELDEDTKQKYRQMNNKQKEDFRM